MPKIPGDNLENSDVDMSSETEAISKTYHELEKEQPGLAMDNLIRQAAQRELAQSKRKSIMHSPFTSSWRTPFALAAIVVVCVALVPILEEGTSLEPPAETKTQLNTQNAPKASSAPAAQDAAAPPSTSAAADQRTRHSESTITRTRPMERQSRPAAGQASKARTSRKENMEYDAAPPIYTEESMTDSTARESPASANAFPRSMDSSAPTASAAPTAQSSAPANVEKLSGKATAKEARKFEGNATQARSPEIWIREIRQLESQGKITEAREALSRFKFVYPNYPLPEDLRALSQP